MKEFSKENNIIFAVAFSQFVAPFMFSGVGITLPTFGADLGASALQLGLTESVYMASTAALLLPFGKYADMTDKKKIFKLGLSLFACLTFLLGLIKNIELFIIFRLFQGIPAAMMMATSMAILAELIPKQNLGKAIGVSIGSVYLGLSSGPFIAGWVTSILGWPYVYFLSSFLILFATIVAFKSIENGPKRNISGFDFLGTLSIIFSLSLLVTGSVSLGKGLYGPIMMALGLLLMIVFVYIQTVASNPLISLSMLTKNSKLKFALTVQLLNYAGSFGITFLFSLYLQTIKGMSPEKAGFTLIIAPILMMTFAPFFGKLSDKVSPSKIAFFGMIFCFSATLVGLTVQSTSPLWKVYLLLSLMGLGFAMFSSPNMNIIMSSVEKNHLSIASAMAAKLRTLGMVISLVLINAFLSTFIGQNMITQQNTDTYIKTMHFSILSFTILMGIGLTLSFYSLFSTKE